RLEMLGAEVPARGREHEAAKANAWQKHAAGERTPLPTERIGDSLVLKRAEEAINAERSQPIVVRGGEARQHLFAETLRAQHHSAFDDRDLEIADLEGSLRRRARGAEVADLEGAQHRPRDDVADPPLGEMHDLSEDRVRAQRFLAPQMRLDERTQVVIGMAKAAEQR